MKTSATAAKTGEAKAPAKSKPAGKTTPKKTAKTTRKAPAKSASTAKSTSKKVASKEATASKAPVTKKTSKKAPATESKSKPSAAKGKAKAAETESVETQAKPRTSAAKSTPKTGAGGKKPAKGADSAPAKPEAKKTESKKPEAKKPESKNSDAKAGAPGADAAAPAGAEADGDDKSGRKGITIVSKKRPRSAKKVVTSRIPAIGFSSGLPRKPMIPSGPKAPPRVADEAPTMAEGVRKSPLKKRELDKFREILLRKRADLIGDVADLEDGALRASSGSLSRLPQHTADQGSETADQSLSLNLAAHERRIIDEIDAALARIRDGVYGLCEMTGKPIQTDRLTEIPWARFSIEAATRMERGGSNN